MDNVFACYLTLEAVFVNSLHLLDVFDRVQSSFVYELLHYHYNNSVRYICIIAFLVV